MLLDRELQFGGSNMAPSWPGNGMAAYDMDFVCDCEIKYTNKRYVFNVDINYVLPLN